MKKFAFKNREAALILVTQELSASELAAYHHRLHALLLLINGLSCRQVAELLGENTRTIQRWLTRFEEQGLDGLNNCKRSGSRPTFTARQMVKIRQYVLTNSSQLTSRGRLRRWNGKLLSEYLSLEYGVVLGVRQCQRLLTKMELPARVYDQRT
jgi:transposase